MIELELLKRIEELSARVAELETRELPPIACRVYNDADISIPNATSTALTFNSERSDVYAMHSTSSNTSRITFSLGGWYYVWGGVAFAANATGYRQVSIRLGGSTPLAVHGDGAPPASFFSYMTVSTLYYFAATNYVELVVYQNSGGSLNVNVAANHSPEFGAIRLP
jgi:hypothetical protein